MLYRLKNISYIYPEAPGKKSLDSVSLEIDNKEFIALIGPVGSGKTTLLKILIGLIKPKEGDIFFRESPLPVKGKALRNIRKQIGMVFQFADNQIFEATVLDEIAFGLKNFDFPKENIENLAREGMLMVGLDPAKFAHKSPFELSGGERKRLALASILALKPDMLLLDEPAAGLDANGRDKLINILTEHRSKGGGLLLVTHDLDLAAELCQRVLILHDGKLVYEGDRSILYDFEKIRQYDLEPPEISWEWQRLIDASVVAGSRVYSLDEAKIILLSR
jgi:energy-coupling factor transport system ATP-binding protein